MVKNHHVIKFISDVSWYELTRQLEYKARWNGREYVKIDTFYVSSQIYCVCSYQNAEIKNLSVREWKCPICGAEHDRIWIIYGVIFTDLDRIRLSQNTIWIIRGVIFAKSKRKT